ncbi:unnamed protein product [Effrenium voratum]|nr:unnamed protein product [Effrenium voratum]
MVAAKRCSEPAVPTEVPGSAKRPRGVASNANQEDANAGPSQELFEGLRRGELLRLLQQTLSDLGLDATCATLERESGLTKEEEALSALRHEVLAKRWDEALQTVQAVDADVRAPVRRMLLEQKCLELHETGHGEAGLELLREDGAEAPHLEGLQAEEPMERLDALLPDLPPRRLPELLWQAVRYQHLHCLYADLDPGLMSTVPCLLKDYSYSPPPLPTHCVARLDHHRDEVWFASVSHDGRLLASSSKDESIVIWERADGAFFAVSEVLVHDEACSVLAWSPNDSLLSASDCTVRIWTLPGAETALVLSKHTEPVSAAAWLPDSTRFVTAGLDRCILLWEIDGTLLHRWELNCRIQDLAATKDGSRLLVVDSDKSLKVFDVHSHSALPCLPESDAVTSICVSRLRDELLVNVAQHVSALHEGPAIRLWDLGSRRVLQRYLGHFQSRFVVRSCFAGDREEMVVSGSEDAQVYIWHRHYGSLLQVLAGHSATVNTVCWMRGSSGVGAWLISASDDGTLRVWGSEAEEPEAEVEAPTPTSGLQEQRREEPPPSPRGAAITRPTLLEDDSETSDEEPESDRQSHSSRPLSLQRAAEAQQLNTVDAMRTLMGLDQNDKTCVAAIWAYHHP